MVSRSRAKHCNLLCIQYMNVCKFITQLSYLLLRLLLNLGRSNLDIATAKLKSLNGSQPPNLELYRFCACGLTWLAFYYFLDSIE